MRGDNSGVTAWGGWNLRGLIQPSRVCSSTATAMLNNQSDQTLPVAGNSLLCGISQSQITFPINSPFQESHSNLCMLVQPSTHFHSQELCGFQEPLLEMDLSILWGLLQLWGGPFYTQGPSFSVGPFIFSTYTYPIALNHDCTLESTRELKKILMPGLTKSSSLGVEPKHWYF